jgi:hypothetical protein
LVEEFLADYSIFTGMKVISFRLKELPWNFSNKSRMDFLEILSGSFLLSGTVLKEAGLS